MREFMNLLESFKTKDGRPIRVWHEENTEYTDIGYDPNWDVYASVDGKTVGSGWFTDDHFCGVQVSERFRRLGVATALYDYMEGLGYYVRPSPNGQEPDGEAFWAARKGTVEEGYLDGGRAPLYHWTNPENARYILDQGKINRKLFAVNAVCVTRDKNFHFNKNSVRIEIDAEKVRRHTRMGPTDYADGYPTLVRIGRRSEREERIDGDVPISAITSITIFDNGFIFVNDYWKKQTQALIDNAKRLGIPLEIKKQPVLAEGSAPQGIDRVAEGLPLAMAMCAAQGYRKGWDGESEVKDDTQFREWVTQRVKAAYAEISQYIRGDTIRIYRAITLPEGETPDTSRHPGICWTFDQEAIHPAHGHLRDHIWVFTAETTTDQIDWAQTLGQNASPGYEAEKEIRLVDYGHIEILDIRDTGEVK